MSPRRVLVAMSGGVDSSVAAALLRDAGHEVVGVTLRLWGGESDSGCCSVSDVEDARRVAQQLDIDHHVFNLADEFAAHVVGPYVDEHLAGRTPNPCIECNRHLKFDRLLQRSVALGFDALATGHHARVIAGPDGGAFLARGADGAKDQSYVLYVLDQAALGRILLPVGELTKAEVRRHAERLGLRTAAKPESQDVCFITSRHGRRGFLADRAPVHAGRVVDRSGAEVGAVDAVELVTVGQRRGLGLSGGAGHRYAVDVDVETRTVTVGTLDELEVPSTILRDVVRTAGEHAGRWSTGGVCAQASAHGRPVPVEVLELGGSQLELRWREPVRRVAPGQSVVLYDGELVLGGGVVAG